MAYLDPSLAFVQAATPTAAPQEFIPVQPQDPGFARTEWAVISLARQDGLETLRAARPSRLGRLIFGQPRSYSLTGERLEVLRRLAVEAWHRPLDISVTALGAFIAAGFTNSQLALLLSTTGALATMSSHAGAAANAAIPQA